MFVRNAIQARVIGLQRANPFSFLSGELLDDYTQRGPTGMTDLKLDVHGQSIWTSYKKQMLQGDPRPWIVRLAIIRMKTEEEIPPISIKSVSDVTRRKRWYALKNKQKCRK